MNNQTDKNKPSGGTGITIVRRADKYAAIRKAAAETRRSGKPQSVTANGRTYTLKIAGGAQIVLHNRDGRVVGRLRVYQGGLPSAIKPPRPSPDDELTLQEATQIAQGVALSLAAEDKSRFRPAEEAFANINARLGITSAAKK